MMAEQQEKQAVEAKKCKATGQVFFVVEDKHYIRADSIETATEIAKLAGLRGKVGYAKRCPLQGTMIYKQVRQVAATEDDLKKMAKTDADESRRRMRVNYERGMYTLTSA